VAGERFVKPDELKLIIRANIDKAVSVTYADGGTEKVFVHTAEAVEKAVALKPDLILLDIGLPTLNGLEASRQIRNLVPESKIIFLSQESSDDVVQQALSAGASRYVVKSRAGSSLLATLIAILSETRLSAVRPRKTANRRISFAEQRQFRFRGVKL
jgi:DNA-binding response OmpR family regulator